MFKYYMFLFIVMVGTMLQGAVVDYRILDQRVVDDRKSLEKRIELDRKISDMIMKEKSDLRDLRAAFRNDESNPERPTYCVAKVCYH